MKSTFKKGEREAENFNNKQYALMVPGFKHEIATLKAENERLQQQLKIANNKINDLQEQLKSSNDKVESLQQQLKEKDENIDYEKKRLYEKCAELTTELKSAQELNREMVEGLEQIAYPIRHLQKTAEKEGAQLNGMMAVDLSNDPNYLKQIAEALLKKAK